LLRLICNALAYFAPPPEADQPVAEILPMFQSG
jgi:hypothetical protein